jgi:hypothetical protein
MAPFSKRLLRDRDYYRNLRRTIGEGGFKVDVNSGNWNEEVVFERINTFLTKMHAGKTFFQYVEMISNHQKRPINRHRFFTTAYLLLDMIGYKSDKLPKPTDNMQNIYNDAEHAFYGAHCDFFVASDRNLLTKARVLYRELNISTVVMSPQNYIVSLESVIHKLPRSAPELFQDVIKHIEQNNVVESYPDEEIETYVVKLPVFYLNFFNYVIYQSFKDQNLICFTCKRVFKNYSDFIYFSESERIIDCLVKLLGCNNLEDYNKQKEEFVYKKTDTKFIWHFKDGKIILGKDEETHWPVMTLVLETNEASDL